MNIIKIASLIIVNIGLAGCYTTTGTVPISESQVDKTNLRLPYLSSVEMPEEITEGSLLEVTIHGSWPDPSWFYYRTDYKITSNEVEISLWGKQNPDSGSVITVLVDFTQTARIPDLKAGQYAVIIHGATENMRKSLVVKPKD